MNLRFTRFFPLLQLAVTSLPLRLVMCCLISVTYLTPAWATVVDVQNVRLSSAVDNTRLVFDLNAAAEYETFTLSNPDRVVIDLYRAQLNANLKKVDLGDSYLLEIRHSERDGNHVRIVLDVKQPVTINSFLLKPSAGYGDRLVIDLQGEAIQTTQAAPQPAPVLLRDVVIALDPGHGGRDPGAVGPSGKYEKHVVLTIAEQIAVLINQQPGMRAVLTREKDEFVALRDRMARARAAGADLFVSVHADGFTDPRVNGASVFILSQGGASSEMALWLAERENRADLVGGVTLDDKDDLLASVLLDLSQTATIESSLDVGAVVLERMGQVTRLHKKNVEHAGFVVLKSPDIPSILVETGFISNPDEERKLHEAGYQRRIAESISEGIYAYFVRRPPLHTQLAARKAGELTHTVVSGDTLSQLAQRYDVRLNDLKALNGLSSDVLVIGQVLQIS